MCLNSSSVKVDSQAKKTDITPVPAEVQPEAQAQTASEVPVLEQAAPSSCDANAAEPQLIENLVLEPVNASDCSQELHYEQSSRAQVDQQLLYAKIYSSSDMDSPPQFEYSFQDSLSNNLTFRVSTSNGHDVLSLTAPPITMELGVLKDFMHRLNAVANDEAADAEAETEAEEDEQDAEAEDAEDAEAETEAEEDAEDAEAETEAEDAEAEDDAEDAEEDAEDAEDGEDAEAEDAEEDNAQDPLPSDQKDDIVKIITILVNSAKDQNHHNMCMIQGLTNALVFACFTLFALSTLYVVTNRNTP